MLLRFCLRAACPSCREETQGEPQDDHGCVGNVGGKATYRNGAFCGLCFLGVAHIPAALHVGTAPSVQLLNFKALKYLNNLKPKKPRVRSGRREVKPLPRTAKWYGQLVCRIAAKITSCCLPMCGWKEHARDWVSLSPLSGFLSAYASAQRLDKM